MKVKTAKQILAQNGIYWANFFDLEFVKKSRSNWVGCETVLIAINRIMDFLRSGK